MFNYLDKIQQTKVLHDAIKYYTMTSTSVYAPYHNLNHTLTVFKWCLLAAQYEQLSEKETNELLLAAIFHDYSHSAGEDTDAENVEVAKHGLFTFFNEYPMYNTEYQFTRIALLIDATQYPYIYKDDELTLQAKILRDADLSFHFESNRFNTVILPLAKEMKKSIHDVLINTITFIDTIQFRTSLFQELWKDTYKDSRNELNTWLNILMT